MAKMDSTTMLIRHIRSRYRTQAYLILAHHFFLGHPLLLDIFIVLFILVSNFMNRQNSFPCHTIVEGIAVLVDQRRNVLV
jgi:hypothetical protein